MNGPVFREAYTTAQILLKTKSPLLDKNEYIQVILSCQEQKLKLRLFDKYLESLDFTKIKEILKSIGGVYKDASYLRARPYWENNELNMSIAKKLNQLGYFNSIRVENGLIRIVVRYK